MSRIVIIGEAWGREEAAAKAAFVGASGKHLRASLRRAGIDPNECFFTNVFNLQPQPTNDIKNLCGKRLEGIPGWPPIVRGQYVRPEYEQEFVRLEREIVNANPNIIIAVGNTPTWFLQKRTVAITRERGGLFETRKIGGKAYKALCTIHPAAVLREWSMNPVFIADLAKAERHSHDPSFVRPAREIWIEPTLEDLAEFERRYMTDPFQPCGIDIETAFGTITEIGFAPSPSHAIVVPFYCRSNGNYWRKLVDEVAAWQWVEHQLSALRQPVFQNGLYDINYLWRTIGIKTLWAGEDTMLLHHALQPEMKKGLGFLGSVYTDEPPWKTMRTDNTTLKREDD